MRASNLLISFLALVTIVSAQAQQSGSEEFCRTLEVTFKEVQTQIAKIDSGEVKFDSNLEKEMINSQLEDQLYHMRTQKSWVCEKVDAEKVKLYSGKTVPPVPCELVPATVAKYRIESNKLAAGEGHFENNVDRQVEIGRIEDAITTMQSFCPVNK